MVVVLILLAVLVVFVGTGAALVASRRRSAALLEPPPDAPRVPPEVLEEVRREAAEREAADADAAAVEEIVRPRFRDRLTRARSALAGAFGSIGGRRKIDEETWEELEEALIRADVGVAA